MACEVPVISTNAGGIPELNIHGQTGFLSEVGDVEDMVKNALFILHEENLPRFKANALARARDFETSHIVPLYEQCYQRAIASVAAHASLPA
jgi:glycosyltransferase involved in cell wall biosynthesis